MVPEKAMVSIAHSQSAIPSHHTERVWLLFIFFSSAASALFGKKPSLCGEGSLGDA